MNRFERTKQPLAALMAFLLCFAMVPTFAFATEANGENGTDASSTATPPTFDPSQTPTPTPTEDESSNESNETTDSVSQGNQEEITIDDDSSDFISEGEVSDEPSAEIAAKAAKLPAARGQVNVTVPTAFNFGGDAGYNVDLGAPEEGYLSTSGLFINRGTGIVQIESLSCTDTGASSLLNGADGEKVFGLVDSSNNAEMRFGYSSGVNTASISEITDADAVSFGLAPSLAAAFECRLYLDEEVSLKSTTADNGISIQSLADVVFTVRALPDGMGDMSNDFYLKDKKTGAVYTAGEVKLHANSIAALGTASPFYEQYQKYIDADIEAVIDNFNNRDVVTYAYENGAVMYEEDGKTPIQDEAEAQKLADANHTGPQPAYIKSFGCNSRKADNDAYELVINFNGEGNKRFRIIGLQADTAVSGIKTGITFESIDTFGGSVKFSTSFHNQPINDWYSYDFSKWNYSTGLDEVEGSNPFFGITLPPHDLWIKKNLPYASYIAYESSTPSQFHILTKSDIINIASPYRFYSEIFKKGDNLLQNYLDSKLYSRYVNNIKDFSVYKDLGYSEKRFLAGKTDYSGGSYMWALIIDGKGDCPSINGGQENINSFNYCLAFSF